MTQSDQIKQEIRGFLDTTPIAKVLTQDKAQRMLVNLYYQTTGRLLDCAGCGNSVKAALAELDIISKSDKDVDYYKPKRMNYILKEKTRVYVSCLGMMVTPHNCTDNNAMAMLGENPDLENRFEKLPKDWKEASNAYYIKMRTPGSKRTQEPPKEAPRAAQAVTVSEEPPTAKAVPSEPKEEPKPVAKAPGKPTKVEPSKPKAKKAKKGKK